MFKKTVDMPLENVMQSAVDLHIKVFNDIFFDRYF